MNKFKVVDKVKYLSLICLGLLILVAYLGFKKVNDMQTNYRIEILQISKNLPLQARRNHQSSVDPVNQSDNDSYDLKRLDSEAIENSEKFGAADNKINYREIIDQFKDRPFVNACDLIDGQSEQSQVLKMFFKLNKEASKPYYLYAKVDSLLGVNFFQFNLPLNNQIIDLLDEKGTGLLQDLRYAKLIYQAKSELEENLELARAIQLRSYYGYILKKIILNRPELIRDAEALSICSTLQNLDKNTNQSELNLMINGYLEKAQVKASDVLFNANYKPDVKIIWTESGFTYHSDSKY